MTVFITTDPGTPVRVTNGVRGVLNIYQVPAARIREFLPVFGSGPFFAVSAAAQAAAETLGLLVVNLGKEVPMSHGDYMLVLDDGNNYQIATWTA